MKRTISYSNFLVSQNTLFQYFFFFGDNAGGFPAYFAPTTPTAGTSLTLWKPATQQALVLNWVLKGSLLAIVVLEGFLPIGKKIGAYSNYKERKYKYIPEKGLQVVHQTS